MRGEPGGSGESRGAGKARADAEAGAPPDGARRTDPRPAGAHDLDALVDAVQGAMGAAQARVEHRQHARMRRELDLDGDGDVRRITWSMDAPEGSGFRGEIPLVTLSPPKFMRITELHLEMDCTVDRDPVDDTLYLVPQPAKRRSRRQTHRLRIELSGAESPCGEVRVDGEHLREIPPRGGASRRATDDDATG